MGERKLLVSANPKSANPSGDTLKGYDEHQSLGANVLLYDTKDNVSKDRYHHLTLKSVKYSREVFSPCSVELAYSLVLSQNHPKEPLAGKLRQQYSGCRVDVCTNEPSQGGTSPRRSFIAKNYYVHSFRMSGINGANPECVLLCYSFDKKLTARKECEAFLGKKFASEIFAAKLKLLKWGEIGQPGYQCSFDRLLMMGYNADAKKKYRDGHHTDELKHPYLVRYNESLYDFFVRVAHRCGEFLYFEDGNLNLGLPEKTRKVMAGVEGEKAVTFQKAPLCTYSNGAVVKEDAHIFAPNYAAGELEVGASDTYVDMQHTSDEYLYNVSNADNLKNVSGSWIFLNALKTICTCDDLVKGASMAALGALSDGIIGAGTIPKGLSNLFESKKYADSSKWISTPMGTVDGRSALNLGNQFYHKVEMLEDISERKRVTMSFSSDFPNLSLGTIVEVDGNKYVVTKVSGTFEQIQNSASLDGTHSAEGVPVMQTSVDAMKSIAFPPRGKVSHYVSVGPMEAVVSRIDDPLRLGRVKVRFPWQKDKKDETQVTPWIRVPVPFAGSSDDGGGYTMTPECGERVIVDFYGGNIERPYVDGSYFFRSGNKYADGHLPAKGGFENTRRFNYPTFKTRAVISGKGHGLTFKDTASTSFLQQSIPLMDVIVSGKNRDDYDKTMEKKSSKLFPVNGGEIVLADGNGLCSISLCPDNRSINIRSDFGTVDMGAFTGINVSAPNGDIMIRGKNVNISAGDRLTLKAGGNIKPAKQSGANIAGSYLGTMIGSLGMSLALDSLKNATGVNLRGCLDLSLMRSLLEILLRPVEGTLSLQSGRNVIFTVGKGVVTIPNDCLSTASNPTYKPVSPLCDAIVLAVNKIDQFCEDVNSLYMGVLSCVRNFLSDTEVLEQILEDGYKNKGEAAWLQAIRNTEQFPGIDNVLKPGENYPRDFVYSMLSEAYTVVLGAAAKYRQKINKSLQDVFNEVSWPKGYNVTVENFPLDYQTLFPDLQAESMWTNGPNGSDDNAAQLFKNRKKIIKRAAVVQLLLQDSSIKYIASKDNDTVPGNLSQYNLNTPDEKVKYLTNVNMTFCSRYITGAGEDWKNLMGSITTYENEPGGVSQFAMGFFKGITDVLGGGLDFTPETGQWKIAPGVQKLLNVKGSSGPRAIWDVSSKGAILMSNTSGRTLKYVPDSGTWQPHYNGDSTGVAQMINDLHLE